MNEDLLISIIIPTFNNEKTIERCLLSIKEQNYSNIEVVVIDGKSTDKTVDIIKKYENILNIKWVTEKDQGVADAMNKGFRLSSGNLCAWIDADNYYNSNIIKEIVDLFKKNSQVDIVYGNLNIIDENKKSSFLYVLPNNISFKKALIYTTGAIPAQPAAFFKKEIFINSGGFDLRYRIAGDFEFWLKILKNNPHIYYLNKTLGNYLKDQKGISQNRKGIIKGYKEMVFICKKFKQPFYGRIIMFLKYFKGFIVSFFK